MLRALLRDFLQSSLPGLDLRDVCDAERAIALARALAPRVIVTDIELPGMTGIELTERMRVLRPETRVVVVSQHDSPSYREHAMAAGAFGFVCKDMIFVELLPLLVHALEPSSAPPARGDS